VRDRVDGAALARAYLEGQNMVQCAAAAGVSASTIGRILHDVGVTVRPAGGPRVPIDPAVLARAYEEGHGVRQCADTFGVSQTTVRRLLRAAGVTMRPPGRPLARSPEPSR
jgi:hypothetical protein